jgi:hypothetical protein
MMDQTLDHGLAQLLRGRPLMVRSSDGTRLHTEVFGPDDGYPIVLSHGTLSSTPPCGPASGR